MERGDLYEVNMITGLIVSLNGKGNLEVQNTRIIQVGNIIASISRDVTISRNHFDAKTSPLRNRETAMVNATFLLFHAQ